MTFSAWFDSLSTAGKIGIAFLLVLAAVGAAVGFVSSIARAAGFIARLFGRGRRHDGTGGSGGG